PCTGRPPDDCCRAMVVTVLMVVAVVMVLTALSWHVGRGPKPAARRIQGSFRAGGERNRGRLRVSPDRRGAHPTTTIEP
ncbi:hypothetical protein NPS74_21675, partial [Cutibacterium acnes subsp. acnes]|nr:hypothetical protein [Cutibacterium acnes subsp. acnes]